MDGDSWIFTSSKTIYLGRPLKLRCSATSPDNITISRKEYDRNVTTQLVTKFGSEVQWEIGETGFSESGVYECISRGISNILTVYIYSSTPNLFLFWSWYIKIDLLESTIQIFDAFVFLSYLRTDVYIYIYILAFQNLKDEVQMIYCGDL